MLSSMYAHVSCKFLVVGSSRDEDVISGFDSGLNLTTHKLENCRQARSLSNFLIGPGGLGPGEEGDLLVGCQDRTVG